MNNEMYLKTAFCCMACDGDIAKEEVDLVKSYIKQSNLFDSLDVEKLLNEYVSSINAQGGAFLNQYLIDLRNESLAEEEEMQIVKIAISMIEANNEIEYSEVKFFKRIRQCLDISDESILTELPDKEDYLLPDVKTPEDDLWVATFNNFNLNIENI